MYRAKSRVTDSFHSSQFDRGITISVSRQKRGLAQSRMKWDLEDVRRWYLQEFSIAREQNLLLPHSSPVEGEQRVERWTKRWLQFWARRGVIFFSKGDEQSRRNKFRNNCRITNFHLKAFSDSPATSQPIALTPRTSRLHQQRSTSVTDLPFLRNFCKDKARQIPAYVLSCMAQNPLGEKKIICNKTNFKNCITQ